MKTLEVAGFDEMLKDLDELPAEALPILEGAMEESLLYLEGIVKEYPPQPSRTRAETFNTYVRGRGQYPKSAFVKGKFSAKAAKVTRAKLNKGIIRFTSQRLGTKWTHQVVRAPEAIEGVLGNTTSYAPYVEGELQTDYHAETGWPRLDQTIDQASEVIYGNFEQACNLIIDLAAGKSK